MNQNDKWETFRKGLTAWKYEQFKFRGFLILSLIFLGITYITNREPDLKEIKTVNLKYKSHRKKNSKTGVTWYFRFDHSSDEYVLGGYDERYFDKSLFNKIQSGDILEMRLIKDGIITIKHKGKTYTDRNSAIKSFQINTSSVRLSAIIAAFIFSIPLFLKTQPVFKFREKDHVLKCNRTSASIVYVVVMIIGVLDLHFFQLMWFK